MGAPSMVKSRFCAKKSATFCLTSSWISTGIVFIPPTPTSVHLWTSRGRAMISTPHLVGFDVEEDVEGRVVLPPQVAVAKLREPRVIPVKIDD